MTAILEKIAFYWNYPFVRYALIVGVLIALCSSLLGVTLVLKRFSFIGDGLSHVAFGAMAIAAVLQITNEMPLVMVITISSAVLLLRTGQNAKIKGDAAIAMISVGALAIGYLVMNIFSTSSNLSGDVCSTLFGSTSILTLSPVEVWLCVGMSVLVVVVFILFYNKIFAVTFDEDFARATGTKAGLYNLLIAIVVAIIIVLAMSIVRYADVQELPQRDDLRRSFVGVVFADWYSGIYPRRNTGRLDNRCCSDCRFRSIVAGRYGYRRCEKMKKLFCVVLIILMLCSLVACGGEENKETADNQTPNASASQNQPMEKESVSAPAASESVQSTDGIDVDLTKLSSTMVYSEVYNMLYTPDDYIGKTVKMKGAFAYYEDPETKEQYFACIIADAMACCSQGLDFIPTDEYTYPDDYPELNAEITVTGAFEIYEKNGIKYCRLANAAIES